MLPIFTIPPAVIESQTQLPLAVAEKDGLKVEVLKAHKLGSLACEFRTRVIGDNLEEYESMTVVVSISTREGGWVDLPSVDLNPWWGGGEGEWYIGADKAQIAKWDGTVKIRIVAIKITQSVLDERAREDERRTKIQKQPKSIQKLLIDRKIKLGFTKEQVRLSWGEPESVNSTVNAHGATEQWVYGLGDYVYLTNGKVVSWQTHR